MSLFGHTTVETEVNDTLAAVQACWTLECKPKPTREVKRYAQMLNALRSVYEDHTVSDQDVLGRTAFMRSMERCKVWRKTHGHR